MSAWSIVIPEETINLVANPKIERDTTGYAAMAGAIARITTSQKFGQASLRISPGAGVDDGAYYGTVTLTNGNTYTASVWFLGQQGIPYKLYFATTAGAELGTPYEFTASGEWQPVFVTYTEATGTLERRIYFTKNNSSNTGIFLIDALQVEEKAYPTTYCDGSQPGCEWLGLPELSASRRLKNKSPGGREVNIIEMGLRVENYYGVGMPPNRHITQGQAKLPGDRFKGRKILPRPLQIRVTSPTQDDRTLHLFRKLLIEAIKPDRQAEDMEFLMYYYGANPSNPAEYRAVYDSGLEYSDTELSVEYIPLRLMAYDPLVYEIGEVATQLDIIEELGPPAHVVARINNEWMRLGTTGFNHEVTDAAECIDGRIVFVGDFTEAGGVAANRIALYNRATDTFAALTTGLNGIAHCVTVAPNGDIYVGGVFNSAGGVAVNNLARWSWSASAWQDVSSGANDIIRDAIIAPDGSLFITGNFTTVGPIPLAAARIARLLPDGTTWAALGAGLDAAGHKLQIRDFGIVNEEHMYVVFVGGDFTDAGGSGAQGVSAYGYGMPGIWWPMQGGVDGVVRALHFGKDKNLYVGGSFSEAGTNLTNPIEANNIAYWYGGVSANKWRQVGDGLEYECRLIGPLDDEGALLVAEVSGALLWPRFSVWNGSSYGPAPFRLMGVTLLYGSLLSKGDYFIYSRNFSEAEVPALNVIDNVGSSSVRPKIVIRRTGGDALQLRGIFNYTTNDNLFMAYNLLDGEMLTIHLDDITRKIESSYFGEVPHAVLRGSNFGRWRLLPGDNDISLFVAEEGAPTIDAYLTYKPTHWSADGFADD